MDVFEAVRTVLAVRNYEDRPVPAEILLRILEAGRLTASSMNGQPWHFVVVENREALRRIGALASHGPYVAGAALAIAVAVDKSSRFGVSDGSRAIQSMVLTAWADGVGSNWVGFLGMNDIKALLGIPEDLELLAVIPFGYPARATGRGKKERRPLEEIAHREKFGWPIA